MGGVRFLRHTVRAYLACVAAGSAAFAAGLLPTGETGFYPGGLDGPLATFATSSRLWAVAFAAVAVTMAVIAVWSPIHAVKREKAVRAAMSVALGVFVCRGVLSIILPVTTRLASPGTAARQGGVWLMVSVGLWVCMSMRAWAGRVR